MTQKSCIRAVTIWGWRLIEEIWYSILLAMRIPVTLIWVYLTSYKQQHPSIIVRDFECLINVIIPLHHFAEFGKGWSISKRCSGIPDSG